MNSNIALQERQVMAEIKYLPAVSIILPFQPTITLKSKLEYRLKFIMAKIEQQLVTHYPAEKAVPVIIKLRNLIRNLNYNTHKKSIAIFVSPVVEKVYYLEVEEEEKITIDESFEIRDLVFSKKQSKEYLVMILSDEHSKMFVGNCFELTLIKSNILLNAKSHQNNLAETVAVGEQDSKHEGISLNEFLHQMDQGLSIILKSYPFPVFIMGTKTVLEQFTKITTNDKKVVQFIEGSFLHITEAEIQKVVLPYVFDWQKVKQKHLLNQLEKAKEENKLAIGLDKVWSAASQNKGRLLIVEQKYAKSPRVGNRHESFYKLDSLNDKAFYIKDEVDEIIEKVFENGGDVEFAEYEILKEYSHIALIENY